MEVSSKDDGSKETPELTAMLEDRDIKRIRELALRKEYATKMAAIKNMKDALELKSLDEIRTMCMAAGITGTGDESRSELADIWISYETRRIENEKTDGDEPVRWASVASDARRMDFLTPKPRTETSSAGETTASRRVTKQSAAEFMGTTGPQVPAPKIRSRIPSELRETGGRAKSAARSMTVEDLMGEPEQWPASISTRIEDTPTFTFPARRVRDGGEISTSRWMPATSMLDLDTPYSVATDPRATPKPKKQARPLIGISETASTATGVSDHSPPDEAR